MAEYIHRKAGRQRIAGRALSPPPPLLPAAACVLLTAAAGQTNIFALVPCGSPLPGKRLAWGAKNAFFFF